MTWAPAAFVWRLSAHGLAQAEKEVRQTTCGAGCERETPEKRRFEDGVAKKWFESDIV